MDKAEKNDMQIHFERYGAVLKELKGKFRIPWQKIVKVQGEEDARLKDWFPESVLPHIRRRSAEKLYAERAGKILFNLFEDDPDETDPVVIEAKKKLKNFVRKV